MLSREGAAARGSFLKRTAFAHRGLHRQDGPPENSLAAFADAFAHGLGVECDVRLSRDGVVHVFHDDSLDRMTGAAGRFADQDSAALARLRLGGTQERVPRLSDLLDLTGPTDPVLVELKADDRLAARALSAAVFADLARHNGAHAVMSFHPAVSQWFAAHAPEVPRGLVLEEARRDPLNRWRDAISVRLSRAQFLAVDIRHLPGRQAQRFRAAGQPVLSWTVRSDADRQRAARDADAIIFEGDLP